MSDNVHWVVEIAIKDGELENLKALMNDAVAATQSNEPNTLNYEWFISEDGESCHIYERCTDSSATMTHLTNFGEKFGQRFMAIAEPRRLVLYGRPNDEVKRALAPFGAVHMNQIGGFKR